MILQIALLCSAPATAQDAPPTAEGAVLPRPALALHMPGESPSEAQGSAVVAIRPSGRIFFRPELAFNQHDFSWANADTDFIFTLRTNAAADIRLPLDIHVFMDLQSYGTYALNAGPLDPAISLYQGYVEFRDMGETPLDLIIGRFEEDSYGTGMLIAPDRFYDGFSLEGARLRYDTDRAVLDVVWSQLYAFDTTGGEGAEFWRNPVLFGTDGTVRIVPGLSAEAYVWWMVAKPFMGWKTQTYTLGGRLFGEAGTGVVVDYSVEGTWQTGSAKGIVDASNTASIAAYAVDPRVGLSVGPVRIGGEYYRASGDDDVTDGVVRSFNPMWQDPHGRFGNMDRYTGSNLQAGILTAEVRLANGPLPTRLGGDGFTLSVLEAGDPSAKVFQDGATPAAGTPTALGLGGDLWCTVPVSHEVSWQINVGAMQPGALVSETTGNSDVQLRGYTTIEAEF